MGQLTILILIALVLFVQSFPYTLYPRILQGMKKKTCETYSGEELPPISIVVPTYNEEHAIRKKLESLLELNYPSYEIIVVDSASTDRTQEIVREFLSRIKTNKIAL
ncbi:MAG: glycosyltransferase, partial [Candidatus Hydrothermarchaeota archaeon]|nr:glycosyltransferase [Candidatus Hydrothermarchaeota archaeon]